MSLGGFTILFLLAQLKYPHLNHNQQNINCNFHTLFHNSLPIFPYFFLFAPVSPYSPISLYITIFPLILLISSHYPTFPLLSPYSPRGTLCVVVYTLGSLFFSLVSGVYFLKHLPKFVSYEYDNSCLNNLSFNVLQLMYGSDTMTHWKITGTNTRWPLI